MDVETKVAESFREALDLESAEEVTSLTYRGHPKWTSLGHMTLVAALEDRFDIMLDSDDILAMSNYHKVVEIMGKYT
jgi:acyl carrier protein